MSAAPILILNVDDNDGARYVKTRILQGAGFKVLEAIDGTDALLMVRQSMPALVLLDVKLPDINGIEVCRRIKADPVTAGVLVLQTSAALTGRDDKIRGLEGGADNYLAAPIEAAELVANVNALLRLQRTQTELRNSEERFRQLTDNIEDVFWMFSLSDDSVLYVSNAYQSMWGRTSAALYANADDWTPAIHPEDREQVVARWLGMRDGERYEQEYRIIVGAGADGGPGAMRWVRDRVFPVRDIANQPYRLARITSDITRRKEMEAMLRASDENKTQFLATLAHELRNPLSPIRNAVVLMDAVSMDQVATHQKARQVITRQVAHLARLVDDLLDVARISEGKLTLQIEEVELQSILTPALETVAPIVAARGHQLAVEVPPEQIWISGDGVRLAQAIGNLLHNAAKFTAREGHITLAVNLSTPGRVHITVRDNGIGITDYNLVRIFDMFAQGAAAPDRAHDGLGIGLSLVATIVAMHGGNLTGDSEGIDQGSVFTVDLPLLRLGADLTPDAGAKATQGKVGLQPRQHLLLVDDNVDSTEIMHALLTQLGHTVQLAHDAKTALTLVYQQRFDAVILDLGMPLVNGYELAAMMRADPALKDLRLIAHTGYGSELDRAKTSAAGFYAHLVKPVQLELLIVALARNQQQ
jgi:PAS domain S-box-containing protein